MNTVVILVQSLFSSQSLPQYWKTVRRKDFSSASKAEKLHDSRRKLQILTARHRGSTPNQSPAAPPEYRFATFLDEGLCLSETGTSKETPREGWAPGSPRGLSGKCVRTDKPVRSTVFISLSWTRAVYSPLTSGHEHQPPTPVSCLDVVGCWRAA